MSLGDLTKQFAKEVVGAQVEEVLGGGAKEAEAKAAKEPGDGAAGLIMAEVQKMQAALKDDKELLVQCKAMGETLRVVEMFAPSDRVLVLTGLDAERVVTRVVAGADSVLLVCKPVGVKEGAKPVRIRFVAAAK
jgi:hypothetical protein